MHLIDIDRRAAGAAFAQSRPPATIGPSNVPNPNTLNHVNSAMRRSRPTMSQATVPDINSIFDWLSPSRGA
jgi:hypothetical protein